jgi:CRISPR-associated protein Cas5d
MCAIGERAISTESHVPLASPWGQYRHVNPGGEIDRWHAMKFETSSGRLDLTGKPVMSKVFAARVRGALACFTRPEMKVERVSYEVMTPSATRGVLDAILWKPAIRWHVHRIAALAPIQWTSFRRNEVRDLASPRVPWLIAAAPDQRSQRNTLALRDVDYVVDCSFAMTARAGARDNVAKFEEMFARRLEKGQHYEPPYLGMREMIADVGPAPDSYTPIDAGVDRALGLMFYDFEPVELGRGRPMFFEARLRSGVGDVPPLDRVIAENGMKSVHRDAPRPLRPR